MMDGNGAMGVVAIAIVGGRRRDGQRRRRRRPPPLTTTTSPPSLVTRPPSHTSHLMLIVAYSPLLRLQRADANADIASPQIAPPRSSRRGKPVFLASTCTLLPIFRDKQVTRKVHDIRFRARIEKIDKPRTPHNRHDLLFLVVHIVHLLLSDRFVLEHDFMPTRSEAAYFRITIIVRLFRPKCKPAYSTNNSIPQSIKLSRWSINPTQVLILPSASLAFSRRQPPRRQMSPLFPNVTAMPMGRCSSSVNREW